MKKDITTLLNFIYEERAGELEPKLRTLMKRWEERFPASVKKRGSELLDLDQSESILITYSHTLRDEAGEKTPLQVLKTFSDSYLQGVFSAIHLLPFYPYTSDDGFSITDYRQVDPLGGDWQDVEALGKNFKLMFDFVLNHCSAKSEWFTKFLAETPPYDEYFISVDPKIDLKDVFRPRALPLLHKFEAKSGEKWVWTTFSEDQVDLNFESPTVFLEFVDILLEYVNRGAGFIRLDAVGFLWKEMGTPCFHHAKTHAVVQLFRAILEKIAPQVVLITETNVPHQENISYFGEGDNEAQMVYQFALPPLTLDAILRQDTTHLQRWSSSLPESEVTHSYFNFLASHDGVGVLAAKEFLAPDQLQSLFDTVEERGGKISYKATPDGEVPYELNINYRSAVSDPKLPADSQIDQFLASQAVMLSMRGVPGIYIHSLLGSTNWEEGVETLGQNRSINREALQWTTLKKELEDTQSDRSKILSRFSHLLKVRSKEVLFDPKSSQQTIKSSPSLLILRRFNESEELFCLINFSSERENVTLPVTLKRSGKGTELISNQSIDPSDVKIPAFGVMWIKIS